MYNIRLNGKSVSASSYAAAARIVTSGANELAATLREASAKPAAVNLYRSRVVAQNARAVLVRQAKNVEAVKVPKVAGSYTGKAGVLNWTIEKV